MADDLAGCLRAWRQRLDPVEVGLSHGQSRRTPGLRRGEVAKQAGISVDYLVRLEQGRARAPSPLVTAALARALRLNATEATHLRRLAGHADITVGAADRRITPSIQRILARFDDVPVIVIDPAWTIVAANSLACALLLDDVVGQNVAVREFVGPRWVKRDAEDEERFERDLVGDLHLQIARHPDDVSLRALIVELRAGSKRFATLWTDPPSSTHSVSRKTFHHPTVGTITVDCDTLEVVGSDLRVVLWTAPTNSPDASSLELLSVLGREQFET
jgi:transcriptional regulator with XRE-family HTH domain